MLYVLDTHVLIWYFIGSHRLHPKLREKVDNVRTQGGRLLVPTIVLAEALDIAEKAVYPARLPACSLASPTALCTIFAQE